MAKARIAVIGAGLMGHGIAQVFALAGHDVTIYDSVAASVDNANARILTNLKELGDDPSAVERVTPIADLDEAVRHRRLRVRGGSADDPRHHERRDQVFHVRKSYHCSILRS